MGAILGAALGHNFDLNIEQERPRDFDLGARERVQTAFFTATFSVMGQVCKADGKISQDEIQVAEAVMAQMQLNPEQRRTAIDLFNQGKQDDFPLGQIIEQFRRECHRRQNLTQMFLEIQLHAAYADGVLHPNEKRLLLQIFGQLGLTRAYFDQLAELVRAQRFFSDDGAHGRKPTHSELLIQAYAALGVTESSTMPEIKKAYRRLMSQHHPDKLVSKGLPEEMIKIATEKTHEIRKAYELIRKHRES